jgi:hypothetical protein
MHKVNLFKFKFFFWTDFLQTFFPNIPKVVEKNQKNFIKGTQKDHWRRCGIIFIIYNEVTLHNKEIKKIRGTFLK